MASKMKDETAMARHVGKIEQVFCDSYSLLLCVSCSKLDFKPSILRGFQKPFCTVQHEFIPMLVEIEQEWQKYWVGCSEYKDDFEVYSMSLHYIPEVK